MKNKLRLILSFTAIFLTTGLLYSQSPPNLGSATSFALFTATGAFSNTGATAVIGDIGTNVGAFTGFPPGTVIGSIHVANSVSSGAATDVGTAYSYLSGVSCGTTLGTTLGGGQTLNASVYCIGAAASLTGSLVLDGQNNPNALFIIKINGALSTAAQSSVILINGASLCNVYWQVNGAVELGTNSTFRGTIVANGAIDLKSGASLSGRGLSVAGAISLKNNAVTIGVTPIASTITALGSTSICAGGSVVLSGNTGGSWNTGALTPSITVTSGGNYFITNTTNCGSVTSNTITVTINPLPILAVNSATICMGDSEALTASGASSYNWSPGAGLNATTGASVSANPSVTTTYSITGTSSLGCAATVTTSVTVLPTPTVSVNSATICLGGSVTLNATGAVGYSWSPAQGLSATTGSGVLADPASTTLYTVTGTTGTCKAAATASVIVLPLPLIAANNATICAGASETLIASGADSFTWSPSTGLSATTGATVIASPLSSTIYTITGTSIAGCTNTTSASVTVLPNLLLTVNAATICIESSATLTAGGASSFSWSPMAGLNATSGASVVASPTLTTVYTVTGTVGSCSAIQTTTVTVNPAPIVTITVSGPTTFCQDDSVTLTATGGSSYVWSNSATTNSISVSSSGSYSVVATDANGCTASSPVTTVMVNSLPQISVNNGVICNGSTATLIASGAIAFSWSPSTGLNASSGASVLANPGVTTLYTVTGTDAAGCINTATASVVVTPSLMLTVNQETICIGESVILTAGGANTFTWGAAAGLTSTTGASVVVNPTITTVYTFTAEAGICSAAASATVTVNPLPVPTITLSGPTTFCQGSSVILSASGGTGYLWSDASTASTLSVSTSGTYSVTVTDMNGCSTTAVPITVLVNPLPTITANNATVCAGASETLIASGADSFTWSPSTGLSATTGATVIASPLSTTIYTITGTSIAGCTNTTSASVTVLPNLLLTVNAATICIGSSATLTAGGASSFSWSPMAGLNATSGASVVASPTLTTVYTVTGTVGSCTAIQTTTVTVNPAPIVTITASGPTTFCQGDAVTLTATGGSSYVWSNSATTNSISVSSSGSYSVVATDANGCTASSSVLPVVVNPLPSATIAMVGSTVLCQGGYVVLSASPGNSYLWNNSATTQSIIVSIAGNYSVQVTDANGCIALSGITTVSVNFLPTVSVSADGPTTFCDGESVILSSSAGSAYLWSNGATTQSIQVTSAGDYSVILTGANGCTVSSAAITVSVRPSPSVNLGNDTTTCGCILLYANSSGGSYLWSTNADYSRINVCKSGTYWVEVSNGMCVTTDTIKITVLPKPVVHIAIDAREVIILDASNAGSSFLWNTGATTQTIEAITAGLYYVTVTNQEGCSASDSMMVGSVAIAENGPHNLPLKLYPNPSADKILTLSLEAGVGSDVVIRVVNVAGILMYSNLQQNVTGEYMQKINLQNLPAGIYFAEVTSGLRRTIKKIVLE